MRRWTRLAVAAALLPLAACGDGEGGKTQTTESTEGAGTDAFCAEARALEDEGLRLAGKEAQRAKAMRFTALAKAAPVEIRDDVEVLRAMWVDADESNLVIAIGGEDAAESIRPYSEFKARHPKSDEAGKRFVAYLGRECRVFL